MSGDLKIRGYTVGQFPNPPLWVAIAALLVALITDTGAVNDIARAILYVALTVWAYEELTRGANGFRKSLGALVLALVVIAVARAVS